DLVFLHRIDDHFSIEDQVGELKQLQTEGKIKHIGLSQVSVEQIKAAQKVANIEAIENLYNVANHQDDDVLDYAADQGMAFLPWFPLA
ncbi:aldo/keto reductase, partial [Staphylococcus epidermidis]|uniref:aldo/keto reductase n=1 Tax=Staphylococcus epidermidis TaxID=1282 RepID=UPI0031203633